MELAPCWVAAKRGVAGRVSWGFLFMGLAIQVVAFALMLAVLLSVTDLYGMAFAFEAFAWLGLAFAVGLLSASAASISMLVAVHRHRIGHVTPGPAAALISARSEPDAGGSGARSDESGSARESVNLGTTQRASTLFD